MSAQGMLTTVIATQLALAVTDDMENGGGCDISAGMFGPKASAFIRELAAGLDNAGGVLPLLDSLLQRIRPGVEAAPWVVEELTRLRIAATPLAYAAPEGQTRILDGGTP